MKLSTSKTLLGILVVGFLITIASSAAMGQGRGRRVSQLDKKCAKFVNCHDARDGRLDGRGPNRRVGLRDTIFRRTRRDRDRDRDNDIFGRRRRGRDRDFDNNRTWRRRR
jgi:hypothetical protein